MIELRRYVSGDVNLITPRAAVAHEFEAQDAALKAGATPPGLAWTLMDRKMPVACGGLVECWRGRWIAWTWVSDLRFSVRRPAGEACRDGVALAVREYGARRIESHVPVAMPMARRFNEKLGFRLEGVARGWGPDGSDYWAMALIVGG
jgi:RimJ/RimL family protein N-acetyltransferase